MSACVSVCVSDYSGFAVFGFLSLFVITSPDKVIIMNS